MQNNRKSLSERLLDFGVRIIGLTVKLNKTAVGRHIGDQLMRSATSSGANYEEACGAESKADFIHKMQLVLKELRESLYWLKLIGRAKLIPTEDLQPLQREADELVKIVAKSVITAKSKEK
ncbi:MAG: four helix bundle protein [Methanophagales archaeon]|nr:four helix bundle protein [Methanophagales archaeon]